MNNNQLVWEAVDKIKEARSALEVARTNLVLAGLGEASIKFQKQLAAIDAKLTNIKNRASKQVGVRDPFSRAI